MIYVLMCLRDYLLISYIEFACRHPRMQLGLGLQDYDHIDYCCWLNVYIDVCRCQAGEVEVEV